MVLSYENAMIRTTCCGLQFLIATSLIMICTSGKNIYENSNYNIVHQKSNNIYKNIKGKCINDFIENVAARPSPSDHFFSQYISVVACLYTSAAFLLCFFLMLFARVHIHGLFYGESTLLMCTHFKYINICMYII